MVIAGIVTLFVAANVFHEIEGLITLSFGFLLLAIASAVHTIKPLLTEIIENLYLLRRASGDPEAQPKPEPAPKRWWFSRR
jgi:hypothetical protein